MPSTIHPVKVTLSANYFQPTPKKKGSHVFDRAEAGRRQREEEGRVKTNGRAKHSTHALYRAMPGGLRYALNAAMPIEKEGGPYLSPEQRGIYLGDTRACWHGRA